MYRRTHAYLSIRTPPSSLQPPFCHYYSCPPPRPLLSFLIFLFSLSFFLFTPLRLVSPPLPPSLNNIGCPDIRNLYLIKAFRLPSSFGPLPKFFPPTVPVGPSLPSTPPAELRPHPSRCTVVYTKLAQSRCCNSQSQGARANHP